MSLNKWVFLGVGVLLLLSVMSYELMFLRQSNSAVEGEIARQGRYLSAAQSAEFSSFDGKVVNGSDIHQAMERFNIKSDLSLYFKLSGGTTTGCFAFNGVSCRSVDYSSEKLLDTTSPTLNKSQVYQTSSPFFISPQGKYQTTLILNAGKVVGIVIKNM